MAFEKMSDVNKNVVLGFVTALAVKEISDLNNNSQAFVSDCSTNIDKKKITKIEIYINI